MLCDMTQLDSSTHCAKAPQWVLGLFTLALMVGLLSLQTGKAADTTPRPLSVVELFSSQACGACPPAIELLEEIAQRPDILALSWSVDYFDHHGWKDTLAKPSFGARQRQYNMQHGVPGVRTPQMVIGGQVDIVGARPSDVEAALAKSEVKSRPIAIQRSSQGVSFDLPATEDIANGIITLVHFWDRVAVDVSAGENKDKTITYKHAVMDIKPIGAWDGSAQHFNLSAAQLCDRGNALLVQNGDTGAILFAALIERP